MKSQDFIITGIAAALSGLMCIALLTTSPADAGDRRYRGYPYGESSDGYGERRAVSNVMEARRLLRDYFAGRDVRIGDIRERDLFFEAEIRDRRGVLTDKVIIDKRTGRIRSMY